MVLSPLCRAIAGSSLGEAAGAGSERDSKQAGRAGSKQGAASRQYCPLDNRGTPPPPRTQGRTRGQPGGHWPTPPLASRVPSPGKASGLTAPCPAPDPRLPSPQDNVTEVWLQSLSVCAWAPGREGQHKRPNPNPGVTLVPDQRREGPASATPALAPLPLRLKCRSLGAGGCRSGFCWRCTRSWSKIQPDLGAPAPARLGVSP